MEIVDTLGLLLGTWTLQRSIEDHRLGIRGWFEGRAMLVDGTPSENSDLGVRARYDEVGEIHFAAHTGRASRSLEYARLDNTAVMLYFADGRPFVDLDLRSGAWRSSHHCGDDHYAIATVVRSHNVVQEHWRASGPTMSYDAVTTLTRRGEFVSGRDGVGLQVPSARNDATA